MEEFRIILISYAKYMCIGTYNTMFSAFIVKLHIQGAEQTYFWIWNKITLCCAAYTVYVHI